MVHQRSGLRRIRECTNMVCHGCTPSLYMHVQLLGWLRVATMGPYITALSLSIMIHEAWLRSCYDPAIIALLAIGWCAGFDHFQLMMLSTLTSNLPTFACAGIFKAG